MMVMVDQIIVLVMMGTVLVIMVMVSASLGFNDNNGVVLMRW